MADPVPVIFQEDVRGALAALNQSYITTLQRKKISILLESVAKDEPNVERLIEKFRKSTTSLPYIPKSIKGEARTILTKMQYSPRSSVDTLADHLKALSTSAPKASILFGHLTNLGGASVRAQFWDVCRKAGAFQCTPHPLLLRITILGSPSSEQFWESLACELPVEELKTIVTYYGDLEPPAITLDLGGHKFPFDIVEEGAIGGIPEPLPDTAGSVGGYLVVKRKAKPALEYYAVTACHVVSNAPLVLECPNLFRGLNVDNDAYLDVAFLKVKSSHVPSLLNPLSSQWPFPEDGGYSTSQSLLNIYTDYWAELLGNAAWKDFATPIRQPVSFPPGTEIEKIGYGTGHTVGWLLNASGEGVFDDETKTKLTVHASAAPGAAPGTSRMQGMIIVRSQPDRPFTAGGDSGSIYYAGQGCMRHPIAIHTGTGNYSVRHPKHAAGLVGQPGVNIVRETVSVGTSLRIAYEWWRSRDYNGDITYTWWVRSNADLPSPQDILQGINEDNIIEADTAGAS